MGISTMMTTRCRRWCLSMQWWWWWWWCKLWTGTGWWHFLQLLTPPPPLPCPQLATTDLSIKANSNKSKRCWILVLLTRVYSVTPLSTSRLPSEECCMEVNLFGRKLFPWNAKSWYSDFYHKTWSGEIMFLGYHLASHFFLNFVTLVVDYGS